MTVAFLNTNTFGRATASPVSAAMSVTNSGANRCAFAIIAYDSAAGMSVSGVTYGGQAMTQAGTPSHNATNQTYAEVWYLVNPPTGSNALAFSVAGTIADIYYNLVAFTGVNQITPVRAGTYQSGTTQTTDTSGNFSIVVSSNTNDLTFTGLNGGPVVLNTTTQTSDGITTLGNDGAGVDHATAAASSVTHTWNMSTAGSASPIALVGFSINGDPNNAGGVWVGSGTRMAPGQKGPFDQRGFLLSPYQRYSYVSSVTTFLVSSADGFTLCEALDGANALIGAAVQQEALSSVSQGQAIIEEAIAALTQGVTVQEEALQGLALVQAVIEEALASAANAVTVKDESTGLIALGATVQDESLASAATGTVVQDEALASANTGQAVIEEALGSATLASTIRYEALATALLSQIVQYEAGGIVTSPVSNSVTVILEALASASQSATNRLESLQQIAITAAVVDELLASATSSVTVRTAAAQSVASLLAVIFESGGLPAGVPMLGINAIVFAAMVTLAALDLMVTTATSDSLATAAASDSLVTLAVTDSLTTTSAFDG